MWNPAFISCLTRLSRPIWLAATAVSCLVFSGGCGHGYELTGDVTFDGKPIPVGSISFAPDSAKGNSGRATVVEIKDGKYTTKGSYGIAGGAYVVEIWGYDGVPVESGEGGKIETGKALFPPYSENVDLPAANGTHDFKVPPEAATRKIQISRPE